VGRELLFSRVRCMMVYQCAAELCSAWMGESPIPPRLCFASTGEAPVATRAMLILHYSRGQFFWRSAWGHTLGDD